MREYLSKCKNYKLVVNYDDFAHSPDDWKDEEIFLVCNYKNDFLIEREGFDVNDIYQYLNYNKNLNFTELVDRGIQLEVDDPEEYANNIIECWEHDKPKDFSNYYIFPININNYYANIRLFKSKDHIIDYGCFILVKKEIANHEQQAELCMEGLLEAWNNYLSGNVYYFELFQANKKYIIDVDTWNKLTEDSKEHEAINWFTEKTEWEKIDGCGGFYGDDITENGILDYIEESIEFAL